MSITLIAFSGGIGYLISKLVDVITNTTPKYEGSKKSLTFFGEFHALRSFCLGMHWFCSCLRFSAEVITLALSIATFVVAILNFRNFGKGLKEQCECCDFGLKNPQMVPDITQNHSEQVSQPKYGVRRFQQRERKGYTLAP